MTKKNQPKLALGIPQQIPFDKLVLAPNNVRRVVSDLAIEELAEDIARRGLLQNLCVRPQLDEAGAETGLFEVPAGGRRLRALAQLVAQKRMAKNAPIPCLVRSEGLAEEDSLAENVQRVPLHPLDQYRAFAALREAGLTDEEIAARFFVSVQVVRQRLRLAAASPVLLAAYESEDLNLDQLIAFCLTDDHARQEQVWQALESAYNKEPYQIRRMLTEGAVRADDRRAVFVGSDAYEAAGGTVVRDLFQQDRGGYFQDAVLLERLALEKLEREADAIRADGWLWVEAALEHPYEKASGMRRIDGEVPELTPEQDAEADALRAEAEALETEHAEADEYPDAVDQRLREIEAALEELENPPAVFEAADIARCGVLISLDRDGAVRAERGYCAPTEADEGSDTDAASTGAGPDDGDQATASSGDRPKPLPDRLLVDLTAWRTMALRDALGEEPAVAQLALLHTLCLQLFYRGSVGSGLEISARCATFPSVAGLQDTAPAQAVATRHAAWQQQLPKEPAALWSRLQSFGAEERAQLLAHCIAQTLDATHQPGNPLGRPRATDPIAVAVGLDPIAAGWTTTAASYLGQVTKTRILDAVREARGEEAARRLDGLKKPDMAREAETLLAGSGWLPEPLRTPKPARDPSGSSANEPAPVIEALAA